MSTQKNNHQEHEEQLHKVRHSLAHLMAAAVLELYPGTTLGIGPVIEDGFYYDFDFKKGTHVTPQDLPRIEKRVRELIKQRLLFTKTVLTFPAAKKRFKDNPYKLELIKELNKEKKKITVYETAADKKVIFADLCGGPHITNTSEITPDAFQLTRIAGAYWRGSEKNPMLTRVYAVAFDSKGNLDAYLARQVDIEKRDHRVLGEKLELFTVNDKVGKGLPLWLPNGYFIRHRIEQYLYDLEEQHGYTHVLTPHLAKEDLYRTSGHLSHYAEDMYAPIDIDGEKYYLRPMNCPHHHMIYSVKPRSYRELPMRLAEFGTVYRHERSGVLTGLIRVRGFTQNDAHIYTSEDHLADELIQILRLHDRVFKHNFHITDYWYRLSLPDFKNKEKYGDIKNKKVWEQGAQDLRNALTHLQLPFVEGKGEATFYGPKIDIQIKNVHGKEDTIATIQVDYYSADRFGLSYIGADGKTHRPVIIHRAIVGSFDRFVAFLLEQTAGVLPLWLLPTHVVILPVSEKHASAAHSILETFRNKGIRATLGDANETLGKRIREMELKKIPYILVVGDKEIAEQTVSVRHYVRGQDGVMSISDCIARITQDIQEKK